MIADERAATGAGRRSRAYPLGRLRPGRIFWVGRRVKKYHPAHPTPSPEGVDNYAPNLRKMQFFAFEDMFSASAITLCVC